jgi:hypothetical protein
MTLDTTFNSISRNALNVPARFFEISQELVDFLFEKISSF